MNFADYHVKTKVLQTDYPLRFVNSIITNFQSAIEVKGSCFIPPSLFDEGKPYNSRDILYFKN